MLYIAKLHMAIRKLWRMKCTSSSPQNKYAYNHPVKFWWWDAADDNNDFDLKKVTLRWVLTLSNIFSFSFSSLLLALYLSCRYLVTLKCNIETLHKIQIYNTLKVRLHITISMAYNMYVSLYANLPSKWPQNSQNLFNLCKMGRWWWPNTQRCY